MDDDRRDCLTSLLLARVPEIAADERERLITPQAETPLEVTNQILDVVKHEPPGRPRVRRREMAALSAQDARFGSPGRVTPSRG